MIKSNTNIKSLSIKVDVTEGGLYYLTEGFQKNLNLLLSKQSYYFAIYVNGNIDKAVSINIKLKSVNDHSPFPALYYFKESNIEFKLDSHSSISTNFNKKHNEFISTFEIEICGKDDHYCSFEVLLLQVESYYDLEDFNIEYKFVEKNKENKNKIVSIILFCSKIFILIALIVIFIRFIYRKCCKKNENPNLNDDINGNNANLLPP